MNLEQLQADLKAFFSHEGLKSSSSIALLTGIPQSSVYRALEKKQVKLTSGLMKLVNYSKININNYQQVNPAECAILMNTIRCVWDGSEAHAKQLSKLLIAAHSCKIKGENAIGRRSGRD